MNRLFVFCFLIFNVVCANGQSYNASGGLRIGTEWGVTGKYRVGKVSTVEAIVQQSFGKDQTMFTALYEHHQQFLGKRFNVYKGGGLHFGSIGDDSKLKEADDPFGITAVGGIELTLERINLSYDLKPAINLSGGYNTIDLQTGISARYVIEKRKMELFKGKKRKKGEREERSKVGKVVDGIFKKKE